MNREWGPGTDTGHGHVWPRPDGARMRCGGPGLCRACTADAATLGGRIGGGAAAPGLRWEQGVGDSWLGHSGAIRPAVVHPVSHTPGLWGWWLWHRAVPGAAHGTADTLADAFAAAQSAWTAWCARAGLVPAPAGDAPGAGWRPIESAWSETEDATFLVWCPGLDVSGPWVVAYRQAGEWIAALTGHPLPVEPTHWMALPEAPGEGQAFALKNAGPEGEP